MTNFTCESRMENYPKIDVGLARIVFLLGFQEFNLRRSMENLPNKLSKS